MYYLNHYVIVWENVKSLDDMKRLIQAMQITFEPNSDMSNIQDLVRLVPKRTPQITLTNCSGLGEGKATDDPAPKS